MAGPVSAPRVVYAKPFGSVEELVARLTDEYLIGTAGAARLCGSPRGGRCRHPSWVARQCMAGTKLPDGSILKLEHIRLPGGAIATSKPAVLRFLAAIQAGATPPAPPVRTPTARQRASEAAAVELEKLGC